jgi:hypothetical protein
MVKYNLQKSKGVNILGRRVYTCTALTALYSSSFFFEKRQHSSTKLN